VNAAERTQISKRLSYVLRHRPDSVGIQLEEGGWVEVEVLQAALAREGEPVPREALAEVVATSDKQRFELSEDGAKSAPGRGIQWKWTWATSRQFRPTCSTTARRGTTSNRSCGPASIEAAGTTFISPPTDRR